MAELFQRWYAVFDGFADVFEVLKTVLNALQRLATFSVKPLQAKVYLVMYTIPGIKVLKKEKNWRL